MTINKQKTDFIASIRQRISKHVPPSLVRIKRILQYYGTRYRCPVCCSNVRLFLPMPDRFRVNLNIDGRRYTPYDYETFHVEQYLCPVCYSTDRDRLYALYLHKFVKDQQPEKRLIHFAPEKELAKTIRKSAKFAYRTADLFMTDVDDRLDITEMHRYSTGSIDCFICSHILEHVPDDTKALKELFRILSPGGWGIIMVPLIPSLDKTYEDFSKTSDEERLRHFGQEDHVRVYAKNDFLNKLRSVGFVVHQLGADDFGKDDFKKCGIAQKSVLYRVAK